MTIVPLLEKISRFVLNPLITLAFAIAFLIFVVGIIQFIGSETADAGREQGKKRIFYGLLGMFIMFSAYGLIHLVLSTFGISSPGYPF